MIRDEKRDLEQRLAEPNGSRDGLIFTALADGHSMRKIGQAAGLTSDRISQVKAAGLDRLDVAVRVAARRETALTNTEVRERAETVLARHSAEPS